MEKERGKMKLPQALLRIKLLEAEIEVSHGLLEERNKLLIAIPRCAEHGLCVPHALEWIKKVKTLAKVIVGEPENCPKEKDARSYNKSV